MDAFRKSTLHALLQKRSLVQIARACLRQSDVVWNLPKTVPTQTPERVLNVVDLVRRAEAAQQIRQQPLDLLEQHEPGLSPLHSPKGQQQEQGFVRSTPTPWPPTR